MSGGPVSADDQEPESPPIPPFTFSTYRTTPSMADDDVPVLELPDGREQMIIRLVGSHPLWGHYLSVVCLIQMLKLIL
jgi:hypothetical protein